MMGEYLSYSTEGFLLMCACGMICSLAYRIFSTVYECTGTKNNLSDMLFYIITSAVCAFLVMGTWYYHNYLLLRWYMPIGLFLGVILYFLLPDRIIKPIFLQIFEKILKILGFIFKILLTPARFLHKIIMVPFRVAEKYFGRVKTRAASCIRRIANEKRIKKQKRRRTQKKLFWQYVGNRNSVRGSITHNDCTGDSRTARN